MHYDRIGRHFLPYKGHKKANLMKKVFFILCIFMMPALSLQASLPEERLENAALEVRAVALMRELRCMVCQNQSIEDSDAPLAYDLRHLVREQIKLGKSNEDIQKFLVARYGEFILLRPALRPATYLLWFAPLLALIAGFFLIGAKLARLAKSHHGKNI
jgi:cytochrome c-type biogenesis protein CcmH